MLMHCNMFSLSLSPDCSIMKKNVVFKPLVATFFFADTGGLEQHIVCVQVDTRRELKSCG